MPRKKSTARGTGGAKRQGRATTRPAKGHGGSAPGSFQCPDCEFVAKHAMGLGRHRSARHGAVSARRQRQAESGGTPKRRGRPPKAATAATGTSARAASPAGWLTRREAAETGGVHYNTVRLWERANLFDTRQQGRDVLIEEAGFRRVLEEKRNAPRGRPVGAKTGTSRRAAKTTASSSGGQTFEVTELLARLDALADGLESLARQVRPRKRRGRPPKR